MLNSTVTCCHLFAAVFQVLHCCVSGSNLHTQQSNYLLSLSDLSTDYDLMLGQVNSFEPPPSQTTVSDFGNLLTVAEGKNMMRAQKCCSFFPSCFCNWCKVASGLSINNLLSEGVVLVKTGSATSSYIIHKRHTASSYLHTILHILAVLR